METDRLREGLSSINMVEDNKGVYWPAFVALGAGTFAIFNFLTRWLLPGGKDTIICLFALKVHCAIVQLFRTTNVVCPTAGKKHCQKSLNCTMHEASEICTT